MAALLKLGILSIAIFLLFPINVHAQAEGSACQYDNSQGQKCNGVQVFQENSSVLSCQPNDPANPDCAAPTTNSVTTPDTINTSPLITGGEGTKVDVTNYKAPQHANYTLENLEHGLLCELAGMSPIGDCVGHKKDKNGVSGLFLYKQVPGGGAIGSLTNVMTALYNPPTSTAMYLADLGQNLGFAKPAYAQVTGSGAGIIKPIYSLWQVTRNLAYIAFTIVFVAVGFMIMFRQKLSQQAVVSAQAALPGLIIGLILVTFSYFIAALIIDVSFIGVQLVTQIFIQSGADNFFGNSTALTDLAKDSNVFHLFSGSFRFGDNYIDVSGGIWKTILQSQGNSALTVLLPAVIGGIIGGVTLGPVGALAGGATGAAIVPILGLVIPLVLILILIIQFFRLLIQLIMAYISLLVNTVIGPLVILYSSIPGRGGALSGWFRTMLANVLIFPAVFAAFLFAGFILATDPKSWSASPPLFGGLSTELLRIILAYGIILGTPGIPDTIKGALGVRDVTGNLSKAALTGTIGGIAAATPIAGGLGRGGVNLVFGTTKLRGDGGIAQQFNARLGQLFKNSPWLRQDARQ